MNTTYFLDNIMGNTFGTKKTPTLPTQFWLGFSTTQPNIDGSSVSEPSVVAGYNRVNLSKLSTPTNGTITNTDPITFNESLSSWGTVTHYVIYDSQVAGNLLMYGNLSLSRTIEQNTSILIKAGELKLALENPS